jgi:hypothetical protein
MFATNLCYRDTLEHRVETPFSGQYSAKCNTKLSAQERGSGLAPDPSLSQLFWTAYRLLPGPIARSRRLAQFRARINPPQTPTIIPVTVSITWYIYALLHENSTRPD